MSTADGTDFRRCLCLLKVAKFIALNYDGQADDEWAGLETQWRILQDVFADWLQS